MVVGLLAVLVAERRHLGPAGMAVGGRPVPPVLVVDVLEGEGGEPLQVGSGGAVGGQPVAAARTRAMAPWARRRASSFSR